MRLGLAVPQFGRFAALPSVTKVAREAEAMGLASLWAGDRLLTPLRPKDRYPGGDGSIPEAHRVFLDPFAVLSVAASRQTAWEGAGLLGLYSLGLGVPFFLAGIAIGPFLAFFQGFKKHLHTVERVMGGLLVLTGVLFLTGNFTRISYWFLETFPVLVTFG